jgi:tripartite-type tricarboxylate transporter receptor subunit TctC
LSPFSDWESIAMNIQSTLRVFLVACLGVCAPLNAQSYPTSPIRFVVPFPAGGVSDVAARVVGQKLTERWGQQVIVENRVGAGGTIGTALVARAKPDGYTLLMGSSTELALNPNLYTRLAYDTTRDFVPLGLIGYSPLLVVVHPSLPVRSLKDLQALARARPGGDVSRGRRGVDDACSADDARPDERHQR